MDKQTLELMMQALFAKNANCPYAILLDAALRYDSTEAHNARCRMAAANAAQDELCAIGFYKTDTDNSYVDRMEAAHYENLERAGIYC